MDLHPFDSGFEAEGTLGDGKRADVQKRNVNPPVGSGAPTSARNLQRGLSKNTELV
jgi:hypothetical protein